MIGCQAKSSVIPIQPGPSLPEVAKAGMSLKGAADFDDVNWHFAVL
jgi:hypothetical protein